MRPWLAGAGDDGDFSTRTEWAGRALPCTENIVPSASEPHLKLELDK